MTNSHLWVPTRDLERILDNALVGRSLAGIALRTRSRVAKEFVCEALGYPIPKAFRKAQPRFVGQKFDTYVQKSNNLQVWNEQVVPTRRYVIIRVDDSESITRVRVLEGSELVKFDKTGTLTHKYQARIVPSDRDAELITREDTSVLSPHVRPNLDLPSGIGPLDDPTVGTLIPIHEVFQRLRKAVGESFLDAGADQERNRGAALHSLACGYLGYSSHHDDGRFPDIRNQLLEVKLQTSPTVDLGLVRPDSKESLDGLTIDGVTVRHCDVRYGLFYAKTDGINVTLTNFLLTTGEGFFKRLPQFRGKTLNRKLQLKLPSDLFVDS